MVEILFDNGLFRNLSIEPADFRDLTSAMDAGKAFYLLVTTDGFQVHLAIQKIVSVTYRKEA